MDFRSPLQAFFENAEKYPDKPFLFQPHRGRWHIQTLAQVAQRVRTVANYLSKHPSSHIGILSLNCADWMVCDLAIMAAGKVSVPIYPTASVSNQKEIIEHAGCKLVLVGKHPDEGALQELFERTGGIDWVSFFRPRDDCEWLETIIESESPLSDITIASADTLATIVYTSGTTGHSKGVMLSYGALSGVFNAVNQVFPISREDRFFSYLPLAHVAERVAVEMAACYYGSEVRFVESLETFNRDICRTRPTIFFAVPRIWEKFRQGIETKLGGRRVSSFILGLPSIGKRIKRLLVRRLGLDHARLCLSAAAPISQSTLQWYADLGIDIYEAYGMTETCGLSNLGLPGISKLGTVGKVLPGCEVSISENGEILLRNPGLMQGYYKMPELTAATVQDGWLRTGDQGHLDEEGFLYITGRVKDLFKTSKGKYVAPAPIEQTIAEHLACEHLCILGRGLPYTALVLVRPTESARQVTRLKKVIAQVNQTLEKHEQIKCILITDEEWNVDNGLLTPTLKVRRQSADERYLPVIASGASGKMGEHKLIRL